MGKFFPAAPAIRVVFVHRSRFPGRWTDYPLGRHQRLPHVIKVAEGKQQVELLGILEQPPVTHFGIAELALDDPERMFDHGAQRSQHAVVKGLLYRQVCALSTLEGKGPNRLAFQAFRRQVAILAGIGPIA
jgi:hypothetical protein